MKKIIFVTLLFTFSNILSGQVAVASFVHLEKGVEKDYNTLEKIWMPFHNSEIKAGKKMFWAVWKIDKAPEMEKAPDYVVFNIFKDEKQLNTYMDNWDSDSSRKKIESLNRGKYSKSVVKNIMNKKIKNEVRSYTIKILHQTVMTGGDAKIGDKISMGAMRQKSDDYETFVPLESKLVFAMMQAYTASVEDFSDQSELMEALTFEQPFSNFKQKVYKIHRADEWIAFRNQQIVELLMG